MPDRSLAAIYLQQGKSLELQHVSLPTLTSGEVLVRVTCCTVCGSDVHTYEGRRTTPMPTILGHEIIGQVARLPGGQQVLDIDGRELFVGDRIAWSIAASCGVCFFCRNNLPQKCETLFKYGHESIDGNHPLSGGLAEYCHLAKGTAIVRLPEALPDMVACPANCATATVAAALRLGGDCRDKVVLVQGAGMLGLSACAMARWLGAREVICCDIDDARLALAARFGATQCISVADGIEPLGEVIRQVSDDRGVDLAIELSGASASVAAGIDLLRIGGRYVLVGSVFPAPDIPVSAEQLVRRCLTIQGLHNYAPQDLVTAVTFLAEHHDQYPFAELVADVFPLEEADQAFKHAIKRRPHRVAVVPRAD